jgi:hypothetical protein
MGLEELFGLTDLTATVGTASDQLTDDALRKAIRALHEIDDAPLSCCGLPRPSSPMEVCACYVMSLTHVRVMLSRLGILGQIQEMMPTTMGAIIRVLESRMTPEEIRSSYEKFFSGADQ